MDLAHHPPSRSQWALLLSTAYYMCGYSQEGDINSIYLLGFHIRAFFFTLNINASAGYGRGQKWRGLKGVFMLNLWSSQDECLLNVEAFLSSMCVWGKFTKTVIIKLEVLMKAFTECQGNPEAQQTNAPWKWSALESLSGKDYLCAWETSIAWTRHVRKLKHEWKGTMCVGMGSSLSGEVSGYEMKCGRRGD